MDIDDAFLNAIVPETACVSLPPEWRKANESGVKKLQKALYGLRQSPRAWYQCHEKKLEELNWTQCEGSPGLWKKKSKHKGWLKVSVYVDDNFLAGANKAELNDELGKILKAFPGRVIKPKDLGNGWVLYDILGADYSYNQQLGEMSITMETYLVKMLAKYGMTGCATVDTPCFDECSLLEDVPEGEAGEAFPYREVLGSLQWAATIARPDVAHPVSTLSRFGNRKPTKARVKAVKKVMKYIAGSLKEGLRYSKSIEKEFERIYGKLMGDKGGKFPKLHIFSDASFALECIGFYSVSGAVLYYRGVAMLWRTAKQTVRAFSTSESEWIAASDAIVASQSAGFAGFFDVCNPKEVELVDEAPVWIDNSSAIQIAKQDSLKPKTRHFALRYHRVREQSDRLFFAPTWLQKADPMTKTTMPAQQRRILLHHTYNPPPPKKTKNENDEVIESIYLTVADMSSFPKASRGECWHI